MEINEHAAVCRGKQQFEAFDLAQKAARNIKRRTGVKIAVYRCPACLLWHITSSSNGKLKRNRKR